MNDVIGTPMQRLLAAHERVTGYHERHAGRGYRITCAACATASLKVAIAEAENGSVLLHAFCGHSPADVLGAMNLTLADLFPYRDLRTMTPQQRRDARRAALFPRWKAALNVLDTESTVLLLAANHLSYGIALTDDDLTRVRVAALRVFDAKEALHG